MTARTIPSIVPLLALCASAGAAAAQEPWRLSVDAPAAVPVKIAAPVSGGKVGP